MTTLVGYNVIKEGFLRSVTEYNTTRRLENFNRDQINSFYDGNLSTPVTTITGTSISGSVFVLEASFGETYDIAYGEYSYNLPTLSGVSITYGLTNGTESAATLSLNGSTVVASGIGDARYVRLTHSCSPGVILQPSQFSLYGVESTRIGFGTSGSSEIKTEYIDNSPVGYRSSTPHPIPLFNSGDTPVDIKIAVAPTGSPIDRYLFIGTTSSGEFYGIDDYGYSVPATEPMSLGNDSFCSYGSFSSFVEDSDWSIFYGQKQSSIKATSDGVKIGVSSEYGFAPSGGSGALIWGLFTKNTFTLDQSFSVSVKVQIKKFSDLFVSTGDIVVGFSNGHPLQAVSYNRQWPYVDESNTSRIGRSGASIGLSRAGGTKKYRLSYADGTAYQYTSITPTIFGGWSEGGSLSFEDFAKVADGSSSNNDDETSDARFRKYTITWDHVDRRVCGYIDGVLIGSARFSVPPVAGCRIFIACMTSDNHSFDVTIKDFEADTDNIYKQKYLTSDDGLTAYTDSILDEDHLPEKLVDGTYNHYDQDTGYTYNYGADEAWISSPNIQTNSAISIELEEPKDIVSISFVNPSSNSFSTVSGTRTSAFLLKQVAISIDGNSSTLYSLDGGYQTVNTILLRDPTSNAPAVASGVRTLAFSLLDFYGTPGSATYDSVAIEEIRLLSEYKEPISVFPRVTNSGSVSWNRGVFSNMRERGGSGYWGIDRTDVYEIARVSDSEQLVPGVDYQTSVSFNPRTSNTFGYDLPMDQTIFRDRTPGWDAYNSDSMWGWFGGYPVWVWRRFKERSNVKAIHLSWASSQQALGPQGYIHKFKVQYLRNGGSTSNEGDWINIPPIATTYSGGGDYATYRSHFVSNNNGEYYTNAAFSFPPTTLTLPSTVVASKDPRWGNSIQLSPADSVINGIYLEFDVAYETDAIRLYITDALNNTRTATASSMNIIFFSVFRENVCGSYLSPIFDTGSRLNTERIVSYTSQEATSSGTIYVRSNKDKPAYKLDDEYLVWHPYGLPLKDTIYDIEGGNTSYGFTPLVNKYSEWPIAGVVRGSKVIFNTKYADQYPVYYDHDKNEWGLLSKMGTLSDDVKADDNVYNNGVILSDGAMYVATIMGDENTLRMMRYDIDADEYGITGWRHLSVSRPPEAANCGMVGYGSLIYLFCIEGAVIEYDANSGTWDPTLAGIPLHGETSRRYFWPVVHQDNVYIVGGTGTYGTPILKIDRYNIPTDKWSTVADIPFYSGISIQAVLHGSRILILPRSAAYGDGQAFSVFDIERGEFDLYSALRLKASNFNTNQNGYFLSGGAWVYGDYLYSFSSHSSTALLAINGLRRCKVKKEDWSNGYLPSMEDPVWGSGGSGNDSWEEVSSYGEIVPQNRYFQFKVQVNTTGQSSVLLSKASVVVPQTIYSVPATGYKDAFIKVGISEQETFEFWYTGINADSLSGGTAFNGYSSGVFYSPGEEEVSIHSPSSVLSSYPSDFNPNVDTHKVSFSSPFVLKNSVGSYSMWVTSFRSPQNNLSLYPTASGSIGYCTSSDGKVWSSVSEVIPLGSQSVYDTEFCSDMSIVKMSPSLYKGWYTGKGLGSEVRRILYCESVNGISWSGFSLAVDNNVGLFEYPDYSGAYAPSVLYDSDSQTFTMWYSGINQLGKSSIIRCISYNGISWSGHKVVIEYGFHGEFDYKASHYPNVIKDVDTYKMWYIGETSSGDSRALYTYSEDGLIWAAPILALSRGLHGSDNGGVGKVGVVCNRQLETQNTYFSGCKVKIYD